MKQLLKEIVKRITDNLLGKSNNNSDNERLAREGSQLVNKKISIIDHVLLFIGFLESIF